MNPLRSFWNWIINREIPFLITEPTWGHILHRVKKLEKKIREKRSPEKKPKKSPTDIRKGNNDKVRRSASSRMA